MPLRQAPPPQGICGALRRMRQVSAALTARLQGQPLPADHFDPEDQQRGDMLIAWAYAVAGDGDNAMRTIEQLYEDRHPHLLWITGPEFDLLRDNPRYRSILARIALPINN